jgi:hypothetical protein
MYVCTLHHSTPIPTWPVCVFDVNVIDAPVLVEQIFQLPLLDVTGQVAAVDDAVTVGHGGGGSTEDGHWRSGVERSVSHFW